MLENKIIELSKKQRIAINRRGAQLGNEAVAITRSVFDPHYDNDVKHNNLRLSHPIYLYKLVRVTIQAMRIVKQDSNGDSYILINDPKDDFRLPLADSKDADVFKTVTPEDVNAAVEKWEETGALTFCFDNEGMTALCCQLNSASELKIKRFAEALLEKSRVFPQVNEVEKKFLKAALGNPNNDND